VLKIHNYQVGSQSSTKVVLIKVLDTISYSGDYVLADPLGTGNQWGYFFIFCPNDGTACGIGELFVDEVSCEAYGGIPATSIDTNAPLYPCLANIGSLPIIIKSQRAAIALFSRSGYKSIISKKFAGRNTILVTGTGNGKYSKPILPQIGDDIVIKHASNLPSKPQVNGEIHRLALSGYTEGDTTGYAYVQGNSKHKKITIPVNSNMVIRINGVATVVGGTSST
jgi:hypothetical protein